MYFGGAFVVSLIRPAVSETALIRSFCRINGDMRDKPFLRRRGNRGKAMASTGVFDRKSPLFAHDRRQKATRLVVFGNANSAVGHRK